MAARARAKTAARGYGGRHKAKRAEWLPVVKAGRASCARCGLPIDPDEPWHLGHFDDDRSRWAGPEHVRCNSGAPRRRQRWQPVKLTAAEPKPERDGLNRADDRWDVDWLRPLRRVPRDATWPRLMTVPHPDAAGSFGKEFAGWAKQRTGTPLRWWQRLVAARLLEHDDREQLVWDTLVLSLARQVGKSWLLREMCLWRIHQGSRFGEKQDVLHTGKDVAICSEVLRPARFWAKEPVRERDYKVIGINGQESIAYLADDSRWLVRAKGAPYGHSVSMVAVDEAWNVKPDYLDSGAVPTMVERVQPQLLLISTAHREATALMLRHRAGALKHLEDAGGELIVEWSAPSGCDLEDRDGWRLASPHWTPQRERTIRRQLEGLLSGEIVDPNEPDPVEAFRAQWLNQWPRQFKPAQTKTEPLLPDGMWAGLARESVDSVGPLFVAVEDNFGRSAAVAAAAVTGDGLIEVAGWFYDDWDTALAAALRLGGGRRIRQLLVGASMLSRVQPGTVPPPEPAGSRETRPGLALFRDLAASGAVVHEPATGELDQAVQAARVKEGTVGLLLESSEQAHLIRALVWAVQAAHRPAPAPAVY